MLCDWVVAAVFDRELNIVFKNVGGFKNIVFLEYDDYAQSLVLPCGNIWAILQGLAHLTLRTYNHVVS